MCGCGKATSATSSASRTASAVDQAFASGARRAPAQSSAPMASTAPTYYPASTPTGAPGTVTLRFRGARAVLVRGPASGVGYSCYPGDTIEAQEFDVSPLIASGLFAR
jgi:hypothetical protein